MAVSVHPGDSFGRMGLTDQRRFVLAEYLMAEALESDDYARAKALLMLSRRGRDEEGWEAGARLGAASALQVKLGLRQALDPAEIASSKLFGHVIAGRSLHQWSANPHQSLIELIDYFQHRATETGAWIYQRMLQKIHSTLSCLTDTQPSRLPV